MAGVEAMLAPDEHVVYKARISRMLYVYAFVLFVLIMAVGRLGNLFATELTLTNRRVIGSTGLFRRRRQSIFYAEITLAKVRQDVLGRLLDYGTLVITAEEGRKYTFRGIAEPAYVRLQIEEAVEVAVLGHRLADYTAEKF